MKFIRFYDEHYGRNHPVFYQGSYSQALSDAKQELRFLLVYLHKDDTQEVEQWCRYFVTLFFFTLNLFFNFCFNFRFNF